MRRRKHHHPNIYSTCIYTVTVRIQNVQLQNTIFSIISLLYGAVMQANCTYATVCNDLSLFPLVKLLLFFLSILLSEI